MDSDTTSARKRATEHSEPSQGPSGVVILEGCFQLDEQGRMWVNEHSYITREGFQAAIAEWNSRHDNPTISHDGRFTFQVPADCPISTERSFSVEGKYIPLTE